MTRRTLSYLTLTLAAAVALSMTAVTVAPALTSAGGKNGNPNPADFSTEIDNPLFPLSSYVTKHFEGTETDPDTGETIAVSLTSTVVDKTRRINGVEVLILEESAYEEGELVERALDYFAQHKDGTVHYFGEQVDNYVDGKLVDHGGTWQAGRQGAEPGIVMPASPAVGQTFNQENAPGVAEDQATVVALNQSVSTSAGNFHGCIKTEDTSPLDPGVIDTKFYCPGVGLVRDESPDGFIELSSFLTTEGADENATSEQLEMDAAATAAPVGAVRNGEGSASGVLSEVTAGASGAEPEDADDGDQDEETAGAGQIDDGEELLSQTGITVEEAIVAAQAAASGTLGEIDLEYDGNGILVFNVDIGDKDVKVDAQTGAVVSVDSDD